MLKESIKWMCIALAAFVLITAGVYALIMRTAAPASGTVLSATPMDTPPVSATELPAEGSASTPAPTASPTPAPTPSPTPTIEPEAARLTRFIDETLAGMTIEEKLGQLVMFGFGGTDAPSDTFTGIMRDYHVGNIALYGPNIESGDSDGGFARAKRLTAALEERNDSGVPLLIAIDVEGGSVVRFAWSPWPSSARTLGRNGDAEAARTQFARIGAALKGAGINVDLAPVLDVAQSPMDTFLTTRILSASAETAGTIGSAIIAGLNDSNCLSTAKHFPGHGGTNADSHEGTPVVDKSFDEMLAYDLAPFADGIAAGVDLVLVAHISYPQLDETHIATQSKTIITGILREELGFSGIVMSDDFRMKGLTDQADVGAAAVNFIEAGGDLILCGAVPDKQRAILDGLKAAVADGRLTTERIDESVRRIFLKKIKVTDWMGAA